MQDAEVTKSFCLTKFIIFFLPIRYYAKLKKMEEEREQELASKYRDRVSKCQCCGRTKKDIDSRLFSALNGVFEKWEMCP